MSRPISDKLRREAVERALSLAQFFATSESTCSEAFSARARMLAYDAVDEIARRATLRGDRDYSTDGRAAEYEDAAKLLMSGWTP